MNEYENLRRVAYGGAVFVPVCHCGRFVKPRARIKFDHGGQPVGWTGKCRRHGKVKMVWEGYL
jgi:hypothetical protein